MVAYPRSGGQRARSWVGREPNLQKLTYRSVCLLHSRKAAGRPSLQMKFWGDPVGTPAPSTPGRKPGASLQGWQCLGELSGQLPLHPTPRFPFPSPVSQRGLGCCWSSHTKQNSRNSRPSRLLAVFSVPFCFFLKVSGAGAQPHDLPCRILADCLCVAYLPPPQLHFSSNDF